MASTCPGSRNRDIEHNFERLEKFLPDFLPTHFEARLEQKIKTRFISPRSEKAETFCQRFFPKGYNESLLEVFLVSPDEFNFDSEITIFAGSIAILNLKLQMIISSSWRVGLKNQQR